MAQTTRVYFCCSPNKRSGSTTTARLLIDYFLTRGPGALGFDTDPHDPDFAKRFPDVVRVVDTAKVQGQIAMFDRLLVHDETPKVVDVQHRFYHSFFETIGQIGFMEEARRAMVLPVALFHLDASPNSLDVAGALAEHWPYLRMVAVRNKGAAPRGPERGGNTRPIPPLATNLDRRARPSDLEDFRRSGFFAAGDPQDAAGKHADGHTDKLEGMADADFPPIPAFRIGGLDGKHAVSVRGAGRGLATKARRAPPGSGEKVGAENIGPRQTRRRSAFPRSRARRRFRLDLDQFALGRNLRETAKSLATSRGAGRERARGPLRPKGVRRARREGVGVS